MSRVSTLIQNFILRPENSWVEKLESIGDTIELDDINTHMDFFYVVRGAVEFTMREDPIHKARKQDTE